MGANTPGAVSVKVLGMESVDAVLAALAELGGTMRGAALLSTTRSDGGGLTNREVMDLLDEGGRPCGPSDEDSKEAAMVFKEAVVARLITMSRTTKTKVAAKVIGQKEADAAASTGLRIAAQLIQRRMAARLNAGQTTDGGQAEPVTEKYAARRLKKYGVPTSAVFKATGQLLANVQAGRIKIYGKGAGSLLNQLLGDFLPK